MSKATTNQSVVLVGGPDAGKTNYLGRLWMALDAETRCDCQEWLATSGRVPANDCLIPSLRGILSENRTRRVRIDVHTCQVGQRWIFRATDCPGLRRRAVGEDPQRASMGCQMGASRRLHGRLYTFFSGHLDAQRRTTQLEQSCGGHEVTGTDRGDECRTCRSCPHRFF
jgi:hypothetical protein